MKLKEFGPRGGRPLRPPLDPPLVSEGHIKVNVKTLGVFWWHQILSGRIKFSFGLTFGSHRVKAKANHFPSCLSFILFIFLACY